MEHTTNNDAARWPAERKPNPSYVYESPQRVWINGVECVEIDAGVFSYAETLYRLGKDKAFPKPPR